MSWFSFFFFTVCGPSKLSATATDYLVWKSLRITGADHSYQVSGCAGCGIGPSISSHWLLDCTM